MDSWDELADWSRALNRDPRAFASIFDHHEGRVFRHSLKLVEGYHDAEDVTAASFFELWRRRERVRIVAGSTLPWLLVTATNVALNTRRSLRRYRAALDRLPREAPTEREDSAVGSRAEDNEDLYRTIRGLNPTDGSLLMLTAVEGIAVNEAATLLGISDGAARVRLHRANQRLRAQLITPIEMMRNVEGAGR